MSFLKQTMYDMETRIYEAPDSFLKEIACQLLMEVNRLNYDLADPNYNYSGRINRAAILYRNATIEKLTNEIKELKKPVPQELLAEIGTFIQKARRTIGENDWYVFLKRFDAIIADKDKTYGLSCDCRKQFELLLEARRQLG